MSWVGKTNLERFLECSSPRVSVHYFTQTIGSCSSSVAKVAISGELRRPRIVLEDVWSAFEELSAFGVGLPLSLGNIEVVTTTQYYTPYLSAIQIFTIKPFAADSSSSSRSSTIGIDGTEIGSANPNSSGSYKPRVLSADQLGHLYFQYNETKKPFERTPLFPKVAELAEQHKGLYSLTSTDLSPYSWLSVAWYPIYSIPAVRNRKEVSAAFLTYHSLKPYIPVGQDDKGNEQGESSTREVALSPFGIVTYKAFGNVWFMPETLDQQNLERLEDSASSWLGTLGFNHSDFNFFMSNKFYGIH